MGMAMRDILRDRGKTHGDYVEMSHTIQAIKRVMRASPNWDKVPDWVKETADSHALKWGRILSGDWDFREHYDDLSGYAQKAAEQCSK